MHAGGLLVFLISHLVLDNPLVHKCGESGYSTDDNAHLLMRKKNKFRTNG
jgi:hypothetical protein